MKALLILFLTISAPAFAQQEEEQVVSPFPETAPPHAVLQHPHREQRDKYLFETFGPPGLLDASVGAGLGQWLNTPDEWGRTETAFTKRFATEYTESAIYATTKYIVARLRDEDPSFRRCDCSGLRRRALHAIISPFLAYRFDDDQPQFSFARLSGTAASSLISGNTWKPGHQDFQTQIGHIALDMLSKAGVDLLREFVFHHRETD